MIFYTTSFRRSVASFLLPLLLVILTSFVRATPTHELLASFGFPPLFPGFDALVQGDDGYYWGTAQVGGDYGFGVIYKVKADGSEWQTVLSFTHNGPTNKGAFPLGGLFNDGLGFLWGTTSYGGAFEVGTVFKLNMNTGVLTTLLDFTSDGVTNRGSNPNAALVSDGAGFLWSATPAGGAGGFGTVFKINLSTGELTTVVEFTGNGPTNKGSSPQARLVSDGAGFLWGTTRTGGALDSGTVYKINTSTGELTTVVEFNRNAPVNRGAVPYGGLAGDGAGSFFGTTSEGGINYGTVYKINAATGVLTTVVEFSGNGPTNTGTAPMAGLASDGAGSFLGTTSRGGATDNGTVFKLNASNGALTTLFEFTNNSGVSSKGSNPSATLASDGAGSFFGTTQSGGTSNNGTVFKINASTGQLTSLAFSGTGTRREGLNPRAGLVSDGAGLLWGTTARGGRNDCGTVFKFNPATGQLTTVVEFSGSSGSSPGYFPTAGLVSDGAGFFWGTTSANFYGGASGFGTVFKVNTSTGDLTTVVEFTDNGAVNKGAHPYAGLVSDGAGSFWGTTLYGGANGLGTVFKISQSTGALTTIVEFTDSETNNRGSHPYADLVSDGVGFLWGSTESGGATGNGTVFKIHAASGVLTTVVEFTGNGGSYNGSGPHGRLLNSGAGYLWGTTAYGGAPGAGTIFKINISTGAFTSVVNLTGNSGPNLGYTPNAGLMDDGTGYFWGTTESGGTAGWGTVFKVNASTGAFTTQLEFTGQGPQANTGSYPGSGPLLKDNDGHLYGSTMNGGASGNGPFSNGGGTIYRIRLGATPTTLAASGLTTTSATLNGSVNPNGTVSVAYFIYGTQPQTLIYNSNFTVATAPSPATATITGLIPGTTYYYRLRAENTDQIQPQYGEILSFKTLGPEIVLEASGASVASGGSAVLPASVTGGTSDLVFTVKNSGTTNLTLGGTPKVAVTGTDAALFTLTSQPTSPISPGGSSTFNVHFSSSSAGLKTAVITLANDDSDENPFSISLSARALSFTQDSDGDGLNDATELQLTGLGFDWQVSQTALVSNLFSGAGGAGLYTTAQVQALHVGTPLIQRNATTGTFTVTIGVEKSTDLQQFTPFPMTAPQTVINGQGKLQFEFPASGNAAFFRLEAR